MRNPWLMRNPWMSLWLSGANAMFGAARAQTQRNANRMAADNVARAVDAWSALLTPPAKVPRKRRQR